MSLIRRTGNEGPQWRARLGVDRRRPGRAITAPQVVHAEDAELAGVESLAGSNEAIPPPFVHFLGPAAVKPRDRGIDAGRVLAAGHGMEEQDHIRLVGIHPAVHLVGQREPGQRRPTRKTSGLPGSWYSKNCVWVLPMDWLMKPGSQAGRSWWVREGDGINVPRQSPGQAVARRAWSRSARMSSMCSMPTLRRTSSGVIPASRCCCSSSCECVVVAGWMARLLASPTLAR